jgi:TonB-like protein
MTRARTFSAISVLIASLCLGCSGHPLQVKELPEPDYPMAARIQNTQGDVHLILRIGTDGRVIDAEGGSEEPPALVQGAEENARQWIFDLSPSDATFPISQEVTYEFRIEGGTKDECVEPPRVVTHLPDRLEIVVTPCTGDHLEYAPTKPSGKAPQP